MSLSSLMQDNYMTVETSEGANQTEDGSIDRAGGWVPIEQFKNISCMVQEKSREIAKLRFGQLDEEHKQVIYHLNEKLWNYNPGDRRNKNQTQLRVITAPDPRNTLIFPVDHHEVVIYEWMGHIEQIRRNKRFFVIRCERSNKWNR